MTGDGAGPPIPRVPPAGGTPFDPGPLRTPIWVTSARPSPPPRPPRRTDPAAAEADSPTPDLPAGDRNRHPVPHAWRPGPGGLARGHRRSGAPGIGAWAAAISALAVVVSALVVAVYMSDDRPVRPGGAVQPGDSPGATAPAATTTPATPSTEAPAVPGVSKIAGPGCPQDATRRFAVAARVAGSMSGGWGEGGCTGRLEVIVLPRGSGVDTLASWSFDLRPGISSCAVSVYVPRPADPADVASYRVEAGGARDDQLLVVRNAGNAGRWVRGAAYPVGRASISVHLLDRAAGPRPSTRLASQVMIDCPAGSR